MKIWVDADACPALIRAILFKAAIRTKVQLTLVANHAIPLSPSPYINFLHVAAGFDVADTEIVKRLNPGDLVITSDIPLAADVIGKGGHILTPRGERYTADDIKARLTMRNFMESLRSSGVDTSGPPPLNQKDRNTFANQLDKFLVEHTRKG